MAREIGKLSAVTVRSKTAPGLYADGGGLYLLVAPTGAKSWIYRFMLAGKRRDMGLGPTHTVSLADARDEALSCRRLVRNRIDPIEHRRARQAETSVKIAKPLATFRKSADEFVDEAEASGRWKDGNSAAIWRSSLAAYAYPTIGDLPVEDITTGHIKTLLDPIWSVKIQTADRLRGRIEEILDRMAALHLPSTDSQRFDNPAAKKRMAAVMAKRGRREKVHFEALPYSELGAFIAALADRPELSARALEFLILTATRTTEALEARWSEFDLEKKIWTIPAARMKGGRAHEVPLTADAMAVLKAVEPLRTHDFVFPGKRPNSALTDRVMLLLRDRMGLKGKFTSHGFRSTFSDWARDCTNFHRDVVEMALAHAVADSTEAAYFRSNLMEKRTRLMQAWADFCTTPPAVAGGNVITLRGGS